MTKPCATVDRPLALRVRADLTAAPVEVAGVTTWIVKDPLTLEHFQFTAEEYMLVDRLRRPASIAQLQRTFAREFPPRTISPQAVWDFLSRLHGAGLLTSDAEGQGHELLAQRRRDGWRHWGLLWTQILAVRFRGVNPDAFLTAAHQRLQWLFSPLVLAVAAAVVLFAVSIVVAHFHQFMARLPEISALAELRNVLWLLVAIGGVKVLHELGHALTAKHYGGEVHELGFMLLAFSPCLYCDVTDAWRLPSKWQRIAVSAAGMAVELVLAAVATIVWWYSQPGVVHLLALNVIVVCTVGTLLLNGNPLLRFDGYYILSDLVEAPNLWQRSRDALREGIGRLLRLDRSYLRGSFQSQESPDPDIADPLAPSGQRLWLAAYGLASKSYVAIICVAIVWALVVLLHPLGLQNVAYAVGLTVLAGALVAPVTGAARLLRNPVRRAELRTGRLSVVAAVGSAALIALLAMPVNYYVRAPLAVMPDDAARLYATVEGTLDHAPLPGRPVARGEVIALLHNPEIELELERLAGDYRLQQLRLQHLERLRGVDAAAGDQIPAARAALADLERRLDDRRRDAERLRLVAPADGVVIPAPRVVAAGGSTAMRTAGGPPAATPPGRLPTWSGSILDVANRGARVEPGTLVCLVGDPNRVSATLLVDDADVKRLGPGQAVWMRLDQLPGQVIEGAVVEVARHEVRDEAGATASRADLTPLLAGIVPPGRAPTRYQAQVAFDSADHRLVIGGRGTAKVAAERISLARWIVRLVGKTFRLPM